MRRQKIKFFYKMETTAIVERFMQKGEKVEKIFCTPVSKFKQISILNICDGAKQFYPKEQKRYPKERYSTNFSRSRTEV